MAADSHPVLKGPVTVYSCRSWIFAERQQWVVSGLLANADIESVYRIPASTVIRSADDNGDPQAQN